MNEVIFQGFGVTVTPWKLVGYLGVILFAVGAIIVTAIFFGTLVVAKREKTYTGSVPLVTFGAITAAIIAAITLAHGAAIYIPTFIWSINAEWLTVDPQVYRLVWWGLGHSSQQINVAAMVAIWYLLGLAYFAFYARKRLVRSPEEDFAIREREGHA